MAKLIVLFNLQKGARKRDYEKWAKTTDLPTVKKLDSIDDFKLYKMKSMLGSDAKPPYQYCEIIEVNDMEKFGADISTRKMTKIAKEFQAFADNPLFILSDQIG